MTDVPDPSSGPDFASYSPSRRGTLIVAAAALLPWPGAKILRMISGQAHGQISARFGSVKDMLRDRRFRYPSAQPGNLVEAGPFQYEIAPSNASDHQLTTAGGLKLYATSAIIRPEQFGITGDGSDELEALQKVLDFASGRGPVHISRAHRIRPSAQRNSLFVRSNTKIVFEAGGKLENLPHRTGAYEMLAIQDANNVEVTNAVIDGRRDLNSSTGGEWGMGISVKGACDNIRLVQPVTDNCWGDGIYVGQGGATGASPVSVEIWDHHANNCRRQGMSIISAHRCVVHRPRWTNTRGTLPMNGLDIEPNRADNVLEDIQILSPSTEGNGGSGIGVNLRRLKKSSKPVHIVITDHTSSNDGGCGVQFAHAGAAGSYVSGTIRYTDATIRNAGQAGIFIRDWDARGPKINIISPKIENPNANGASPARVRAGITIYNGPKDDSAAVGNILIQNPSIVDSRTKPGISRYFFVQNARRPNAVKDVAILDPVKLRGASLNWVEGQVEWSDKFAQDRIVNDDCERPYPVSASHFSGLYSNRGANGVVVFELSDGAPAGWPDVNFTAEKPYPLRVSAPSGGVILYNGATGKHLTLPPGGRMTLRCVAGKKWKVISSSGEPTFTSKPHRVCVTG